MSDYRVVANRSEKLLRQRFYVTIIAANGEVLFTSEMLKDHDYAIERAQQTAGDLDGIFIVDGIFIDET